MQSALQRVRQRKYYFQVGCNGVYLRDNLRSDRVDNIEAMHRISQLIRDLVDAIKCLEERTKSPAYRNVKAMFFPIEVAAHRPEEIIVMGQLVSSVVGESL